MIVNPYLAVIMQILRSWREQKVLLKRWFPILNDEDFEYPDDQKETMLDRLAAKLDKSRDELELIFADLQRH
ncbi:MAG: hypothetical protein RJQ09_14450 [Cyclobacteriaceae bacterium]